MDSLAAMSVESLGDETSESPKQKLQKIGEMKISIEPPKKRFTSAHSTPTKTPPRKNSYDEQDEDEEDESSEADTSDEEEGQPLESDALIALTNLEFASNGNQKRKRQEEGTVDPEEWKPINGKKRKKKKKLNEQSQRKSKWLVAAVQVLTEESERGIYAMGVSQIWTKIRDAGLMDFQGKTPRNSLSSALSAAKSKGSNSVIVYNEGLYALRKYKHKLEEGSRVKNISWENTNEEDQKNSSFQWIGASNYKKGNKTFYSAVRVDGTIYRVGDYAYFRSPEDDDRNIGQLTGFFEDDMGSFVESIWYFFPDETHCGRTKDHEDDEIFAGDTKDYYPLDMLQSKAEVLSMDDYNRRAESESLTKDTYFCRSHYRVDEKKFIPIKTEDNGSGSGSENGHRDISPKIQETDYSEKIRALDMEIDRLNEENKKLRRQLRQESQGDQQVPANWPNGLVYTSTLNWNTLDPKTRDLVYSKFLSNVELRSIKNSDSQGERLGVFATRDIPKETIIGQIAGKVVENKNEEKAGNTVLLYEDEHTTLEIDTSEFANEAKFINDFRGITVEPNVKRSNVNVGGHHLVFVICTKDILKNQEVVGDYGWEPGAASS